MSHVRSDETDEMEIQAPGMKISNWFPQLGHRPVRSAVLLGHGETGSQAVWEPFWISLSNASSFVLLLPGYLRKRRSVGEDCVGGGKDLTELKIAMLEDEEDEEEWESPLEDEEDEDDEGWWEAPLEDEEDKKEWDLKTAFR
ncbi:hypothetical protein CYMTET_37512 [Cymbomonas tetramitiformis]|uniref:Uncharacterized protein n=1 Tax=Cymbomonas tetramitiformis TaxID=36881 RepID=A0AAE0F6D2_9CHLO|nr:hypothetical protein CYMTET_37512 [Cymbomonas tetramitiformis]